MAPKKKDGEAKKKKGTKPPWMSDELFEVTQSLPKLQEFWSGDVKESKGKTDKPAPNLTRTEAGLYILQHIFPSSKPAKEKKEECIKLGVVECSVKVLASQKPQDCVSAAHILAVMAETFDQSRQVMMDSKPAIIPQILSALANQDSAPLKAALCGLLRVIARHDDTRPRLWRQLKDWDWKYLVSCLCMQGLSQLGGRNAAHDAMAVLEALCTATEGEVGSISCTNIINAGGIQAIVSILQDRISHPMARAAGVSVLNQVMRRAPATVCEEVVVGSGALKPLVGLLSLATVPLTHKAHAAAVLLRYILPDSMWKNSSMLPGGAIRPQTAVMAPGGVAALEEGLGNTTSEGQAQDAAGGTASVVTARMDVLKLEMSKTLEAGGGKGTGAAAGASTRPGTAANFLDAAVPDDHILDESTKAEIAKRSKVVAEAGAISSLVQLCNGPDGPLPDLEQATAGADADAGAEKGGKGKPKKKKGKKKAKLEPGMAESQTWASAVLRMISLDADHRETVAKAGAVRYLVPLLESKVHAARWNARQTLINLSMTPSLVTHLELYKVPAYIHGANIPARHFERPFPSSGVVDEGLQRIPAHLASAVTAAQKDIMARGGPTTGVTLNAAGAAKPPPLKPIGAKAAGGS